MTAEGRFATPEDELILRANYHFRRSPEIQKSINWLSGNPEQFRERISVFNDVIESMNAKMLSHEPIEASLSDLQNLKAITGPGLPTINNAIENTHLHPVIAVTTRNVFRQASEDFPEWADKEYSRPATSAIGSLIEGYGLLLGKLMHGNDDGKAAATQRTFVKAFEEMLITDFPDSSLLADVIDWMIEEKEDFPAEIQSRLEEKQN